MIEEIINSFKNLDTYLWISQICGFIGFIIISIAYLFGKKKFLIIATISFVFFILEQSFALLYANLIVTGICFIRNIFMVIMIIRKNKPLPFIVLLGFVLLIWIFEIIYMSISNTFNVIDNYLPPLIVTMSSFTQNSKNEYVVKCGGIVHEGGFLAYYAIYKLPLSIFREIVLVLFGFVGLFFLIYNRRKIKNKNLE